MFSGEGYRDVEMDLDCDDCGEVGTYTVTLQGSVTVVDHPECFHCGSIIVVNENWL